jgi:hypothetical protein
MMNKSAIRAFRRCWFALAFSFLILPGVVARAGDLKLEAQLIWGTNDKQSPDPKHKPVDADVREKMANLPFKWANYFEVNRKAFVLPNGEVRKIPLSEKFAIEVMAPDGKKVEVTWFGEKGELLVKQRQPLPQGKMLVFGGNAPHATSWFVTLKHIE